MKGVMRMEITYETKIKDLLNEYPEAIEVFLANGFTFQSKEKFLESAYVDLMLGTVLVAKEIDVNMFIRALYEKITNSCPMAEIDYSFYEPNKPVHLFVKTPCPINAMLKENLSIFLQEHERKTSKKTNCFIANKNNSESALTKYWELENEDELPDIIMSMAFDGIYDKSFIDRFVNKGIFENVLPDTESNFPNEVFQDDSYTLNASLAMVFLIDEKRLAQLNLPKPKSWVDVLNSIYLNEIISLGDENTGAFTYPLFYLYKAFGIEGIKKLAKNTKDVYHGSQMARKAGSNSKEAASIYLLPLTFARIPNNKNLSIVYPEDGVFLFPISFLVKKNKREELNYLIDFLLKDYGEMCTNMHALSFHKEIQNDIPTNINLKWLGWDYMKTQDIPSLGERLKKEFHQTMDQAKQTKTEVS